MRRGAPHCHLEIEWYVEFHRYRSVCFQDYDGESAQTTEYEGYPTEQESVAIYIDNISKFLTKG